MTGKVNGISLKLQIGFIVVLATLVFVAVGGIYFWGTSQQDQVESRVAQALEIRDAAESVQFFLMDARRLERDVLFSRSLDADDAIIQHKENLKAATARLKAILPIMANDQDRALANRIISGIDGYRTQFIKAADLQMEVGTNENEGLLGRLRASVHTAEATLAQSHQDHLTMLMLMMRRHEKDFLARLDAKYVAEHSKRAAEFDGALQSAGLSAADKAQVTADMAKYAADFHSVADGILNLVLEAKSLEQSYTRFAPDLQALRNMANTMTNDAKSESSVVIAMTSRVIAFSLVAGTIFVALLGTAITWAINRPLLQTTHVMVQLAEGDLMAEIPTKSWTTEILHMTHALQVFKNNAQEADRLRHEQEQARTVAEQEKRKALGIMAETVERETRLAVTMISQQTGIMTDNAVGMAQSAEEVAENSHQVAGAASDAEANAQAVASAAEELSASIGEISSQINTSSAIIVEAVAATRRSQDIIGHLSQAVDKISEVTALINTIASQTNLLALNATIEAARAGEMGKGFAVVANEVKNLANQTAKATEEITAQIADIQSTTTAAVQSVGAISDSILQVENVSTAVAAAVEEQGVATAEIARNVCQSSQASNDVASRIALVSEEARDTGHKAEHIQSLSATVASSIQQLQTTLIRVVREATA